MWWKLDVSTYVILYMKSHIRYGAFLCLYDKFFYKNNYKETIMKGWFIALTVWLISMVIMLTGFIVILFAMYLNCVFFVFFYL